MPVGCGVPGAGPSSGRNSASPVLWTRYLKVIARGQVLAEQHVGRVDRIDHVAERRIALDPELHVIAGDELAITQREHHVLDPYRPLEQRWVGSLLLGAAFGFSRLPVAGTFHLQA